MIDVLVIGGGNAALCAAIAARRAGARVLLLEAAPQVHRGGDSRYTRNLRYLHEEATEYLSGPYGEEEFWQDLREVSEGNLDEHLVRLTIRESRDLGRFIVEQGGRFQPPLAGTLGLARTNAFFLGGGKALINAYYDTAEALGVEIRYEAEAMELEIVDGTFRSAKCRIGERLEDVPARSVVVASGGFQANRSWLREAWGDAAENFVIRGTEYNQGHMLRSLFDHGARPAGEPTQCHAIAVDARSPRHDGGIVTRLDCIPFGIVVNREGRRFYDEGEDVWPRRYAIWGRLIASEGGQIAYAIVDDKVKDTFMPSLYPPIVADSIDGLAQRLKLEGVALQETVSRFNDAVQPGHFDPDGLDDCRTVGLDPPKSHWAQRLDTPPFAAYPLRPGITFTYLGVKVSERAEVLLGEDRAMSNVHAAGEIMAGSVIGQGYLAGFGMTVGTVFGRIAGREAARHASL